MNESLLSRRRLLLSALATLALPAWAAPARPRVDVWKDPNCGCCGDWVKHLEAKALPCASLPRAPMRPVAGSACPMPTPLATPRWLMAMCWKATSRRPTFAACWPINPRPWGWPCRACRLSSPGMDGPVYQGRRDPYEVLLVSRDGRAAVFASYR